MYVCNGICVGICVSMWYVYVYGYIPVCVYICILVISCVWMRVIAISDSFGEIRTCYMRFRLVAVMDPIYWRFEDRSMRWPGDPYRFVQWRPDEDSVPKPHHFMWVFAFVLFPNLLLPIAICVLLVSFHVTMWYILPV